MPEIITADHIYKSYNGVHALNDISFSVSKGELYGFIGPDGSGKSTLFRILTSLILPDKGTAQIFGNNVVKHYKKIRQITGYMPGRFSLYSDLSIEENLEFFATVFGTTISENYNLIKDVYRQIEPFKNRRAGKLSGGMKQKLALSCALIHKPEVLLLDEPTTGVDAVSRIEFWELLKGLKNKGITILVSTPYMDEAQLCDRVALIQNGKILSTDKPENISKQMNKPYYGVSSDNIHALLNDLRNYKQTISAYAFGREIHLQTKEIPEKSEIKIYLENKNHRQIKIRKINPGIEDVFIELMHRNK